MKTMNGSQVQLAGLVISRQRPSSVSGVIFLTLEDETGVANIIVWRDIAERYRRALLNAAALKVKGKLERQAEVLHVVAQKLEELHLGAALRLPDAPAIRR
jgi:DNA polymerase III alpha subunit